MNGSSSTTVIMVEKTQQCHDDCSDDDDEKRTHPPGMNIVTKLGPHDVLMGRGTPTMAHPGNIRFRRLVSSRKFDYVQALRRRDKDEIARDIVSIVKSQNGLFLRKVVDNSSSTTLPVDTKGDGACAWMTVPDEAVILKVKQALRDGGGGPLQVDEHKAQQKAATLSRRKRRLVETEPIIITTMCQETATNLDVTIVPYLQQLVANVLHEYQKQCSKRSRLSSQHQLSNQQHHHPKFNLSHCCAQSVEEETVTRKAHPTDVPLLQPPPPPMSRDDIAASSSSPSPPPPPVVMNKTTEGLDILKKAAMLLEGGDTDDIVHSDM